jgi:hypothetical protein
MPDTFSGSIKTQVDVSRSDVQTLGTNVSSVSKSGSYSLDNVLGPLSDQIWFSSGSVTGGASITLDLLNLTGPTFGVTQTQTMRQVRLFRLQNNETVTGPRIIVGPGTSNGWGRVAGDVGPGGELLAVQQAHAWPASSTESTVKLTATGTTGMVSYSLMVCGTAITGPAGY